MSEASSRPKHDRLRKTGCHTSCFLEVKICWPGTTRSIISVISCTDKIIRTKTFRAGWLSCHIFHNIKTKQRGSEPTLVARRGVEHLLEGGSFRELFTETDNTSLIHASFDTTQGTYSVVVPKMYTEFGSRSGILAQFGSRSRVMLSFLREKKIVKIILERMSFFFQNFLFFNLQEKNGSGRNFQSALSLNAGEFLSSSSILFLHLLPLFYSTVFLSEWIRIRIQITDPNLQSC